MLKRIRTIVLVTAALVIVAIIVSSFFSSNQIHPISTPPLYQIVNGNFTVDANSYKAYNFTIPTDFSNCQVSGSFSVYGANSSKIRVFIWDNAAFTNWQKNGQSLQWGFGTISFYDSTFTTNSTISLSPYPSGTYWLIYTNNSTEPQHVTSEASFCVL